MIEFKVLNKRKYNKTGIQLWRYLNIHNFISFIKTKQIRFTRMDDFEDPLEGVHLKALITYAGERDLELIGEEKLSDLILDEKNFNKLSPDLKKRIEIIKEIQHTSFVSCWFLSLRESMAMWNLYSNSDGVAIYISAKRLFEHFTNETFIKQNNKVAAFYAGKVIYQDFTKIDGSQIDPANKVPKITLRKDISFQHENEFRFVVRKEKNTKEIKAFNSTIKNLSELNVRVICHPRMELWKKNNIKKLLEDANIPKAFKESEIRLRKK